jgi:hypothetical protein
MSWKISPLWQKAIKQAVSSASAVVITNLADQQSAVFSWPWFRHVLIAMFFLTLVNEARYWQEWANGPVQASDLDAKLQVAQDANQQVADAVAGAKTAASATEKPKG